MKKNYLLIVLLINCILPTFSQNDVNKNVQYCVSFGVGHGGGHTIGADFEAIAYKFIGIQGGLGYSFASVIESPGIGLTMRFTDALVLFSLGPNLSIDGAINIHLKPYIRSNYFSLLYWYRFGNFDAWKNPFIQNILGATFSLRTKKWFTMQFGIGTPISPSANNPKTLLLFSIGGYLAK